MPCPNCSCPSCLTLMGSTSAGFSLPPSKLITENHAPTISEAAYSRDAICFAEKTIPLVQAMIDDLEKRKAELLDLASAHKVAISPLRTFPSELLAKIFMEFVTMERRQTPSRNYSPFMLMGICSRWRKIVLDTPRLWTRILGAPPAPMINSWITQSKELPFDLGLDLNMSNSHPVLEALIPHAHRWGHINFSLRPNSPYVLACVRTRLHSLKSLALSFGDTTGTVDFCEVAPQLTEIGLGEIYERVIIKLPWEQLRACTLDNSGLALYVLQHAKNLQTLNLDMSRLSETPWLSTPRDPHSCHMGLDTLVTYWSRADPNLNSFFSSITLPSLQTLEVCFDSAEVDSNIRSPPEFAPAVMSGFIQRSAKHLHTLALIEIPVFPLDELIMCFAFTPSLVTLDIHFGSESRSDEVNLDELLHALNVNIPGYALPRLRSLSLEGMSIFSEEALDGVIASRRDINPKNDGVTLLEHLTLECLVPQGQSTSQLPRFHRFVSGGLNITYGEDWGVYNSI